MAAFLNMGVQNLDDIEAEFGAASAAGEEPSLLVGEAALTPISSQASSGVQSLTAFDAETPLIASPAVAAQAATTQSTAVQPVNWLSSLFNKAVGGMVGAPANGSDSWLGARGATLIAGFGILIVGLTMLRPVQQAFGVATKAARDAAA